MCGCVTVWQRTGDYSVTRKPTWQARVSVIFLSKSDLGRMSSPEPRGGGARHNGQYCDDHVRQLAVHHDRPELCGIAADSKEVGHQAVLTFDKSDRAVIDAPWPGGGSRPRLAAYLPLSLPLPRLSRAAGARRFPPRTRRFRQLACHPL